MSNKPYKQFFYGKGISKTTYGRKPMRWTPNTYVDTYNTETGRFRSRRKYGKDGWAYKDMDTADNHRPYDHIHNIDKGFRSTTPRKPNKTEREEFKKAKRKRRFF